MKILCIFSVAPRYRKAIYEKMDAELNVDLVVGDYSAEKVELLTTEEVKRLQGFRGYAQNVYKNQKLIWQKGAIGKAFSRRYDAYILTGNAGIRSNWIIILFARIVRKKVYLWTHGIPANVTRIGLLKNILYLKFAGRLLLYGPRVYQILKQRGFKENRMAVIYNSLDYDCQIKIRENIDDGAFIKNHFGNDLPTICFVGRLTKVKKIDQVIRAIQHLQCNLILIGDGTERMYLEQLSKELGIEKKVWFYGQTFDEKFIGSVLYHSKACVSPGNMGLTGIHSLTFGTPFVTHCNLKNQMPEVDAIVPGRTGYFFEENNVEELSKTIHTCISTNQDEREMHRKYCYEMIANYYNPSNQIEIMKKFFSKK